MKFGLPISIILHTALIFGGLVMWGGPIVEMPSTKVIALDMITVSDVTNIKRTVRKPDPVLADPDPLPTPQPETVPETVPDIPAETIPALPDGKGENTPSQPTEPVFDLDALADQFNDIREDNPNGNTQKTLSSESEIIDEDEITRMGAGEKSSLTTDAKDYIKAKVKTCWNIDDGAKDYKTLLTVIQLELDSRGHIVSADVVNNLEINQSGNKAWQAARDKVVMALDACQPYSELPLKYFYVWDNLTLNFQPET